MKKSKSASKKNSPVKFVSETNDAEQFEKMMKQSSVDALSKKEGVHKQKQNPKKQKSEESIEFQEDLDWSSHIAKKSLKGKFAGQKKRSIKKLIERKVPSTFQPDATLDLHGETRNGALIRVERFLQNSKKRRFQSVLIITGRGLNSAENRGVLKTTIWEWLKNQRDKYSIRFQKAPDFLGGEGAVLIFF